MDHRRHQAVELEVIIGTSDLKPLRVIDIADSKQRNGTWSQGVYFWIFD